MSSSSVDWKKLLVAAGATAGACAVLYYLLKEDGATPSQQYKDMKKKAKAELSKEEFIQLLQEISTTQSAMKTMTKDVTAKFKRQSSAVSFESVYAAVCQVPRPADPMEKAGVSYEEFDELLRKYEREEKVRRQLEELMGGPGPTDPSSSKAKDTSVKKILDVHRFMQVEFEALTKYIQALPSTAKYDTKMSIIAAQIIIEVKVDEKFGLSQTDIEESVSMFHSVLASDQEFAAVNAKIQTTLGKLQGALPRA